MLNSPLPPDPREEGYDYRLDVSLGDKNDIQGSQEVTKPLRKLSFERNIRVQEFEKDRSSGEIRKLVRTDDTKEIAPDPDGWHKQDNSHQWDDVRRQRFHDNHGGRGGHSGNR
ncbi:hypothetical protein IscW_ISCW016941 [Ixodes scapularis]|uniref:Uncharacterized protein n=1 Tax=Ixodes scapularis TaxID=6945 RepID=B7PDH5_IXOSC|nr:hypothetical protein IscW_ISCW016941 [Ixodes scapularis]|eukprot:XP_002410809.1 hypothetical protein IscW_ISCW016941 [Ixodes scapularis]